MSENRSQMADFSDDERLYRGLWRKPKWWDSTPPELRALRREYPSWSEWSKYDDVQPQAQGTPEKENARLEQRSPNDDFLDGKRGAEKWNKTRRGL